MGPDRDVLNPLSVVFISTPSASYTMDNATQPSLAAAVLRGLRQASVTDSASSADEAAHPAASGPTASPGQTATVVFAASRQDCEKFKLQYASIVSHLRLVRQCEENAKIYYSAKVPEKVAPDLVELFNLFAQARFKGAGCATEHAGELPDITVVVHRPFIPADKQGAKDKDRHKGGSLPSAWPAAFLLVAAKHTSTAFLRPGPDTGPDRAATELVVGVSNPHQALQVRHLAEHFRLRARCEPITSATVRLHTECPMGFNDAAKAVGDVIDAVCGPTAQFKPGATWHVPAAMVARLLPRLEAAEVRKAVGVQRLELPEQRSS